MTLVQEKPKRKAPKSAFKAGDPRIYRGGRPPGTANKVPQSFKDTIVEAVKLLGGAQGLVDWVRKDPANERDFWVEIAPRVLPKILEGNPDAPIPLQVIERRVIPPGPLIDADVVDVTEE